MRDCSYAKSAEVVRQGRGYPVGIPSERERGQLAVFCGNVAVKVMRNVNGPVLVQQCEIPQFLRASLLIEATGPRKQRMVEAMVSMGP